jgi:hypothetical protein
VCQGRQALCGQPRRSDLDVAASGGVPASAEVCPHAPPASDRAVDRPARGRHSAVEVVSLRRGGDPPQAAQGPAPGQEEEFRGDRRHSARGAAQGRA